MKIEMRDIETVTPYDRNPRKNDGAVDAIAESIREFGFRVPMVVDEAGIIVAGHTRLLAARKLGMKEVPVHVATDLSPEQIKAYRLADNKLHELSEWDYDLLPIELSDLRGMDVDLDLLGFSSEELEKMLGAGVHGNEGLTDPDAVPEPPDEPVTQPGDLWVLGNHRLLCGDSGRTEDVDRLLDGATIHLVNTDPPYNVRLEPRSNNAIAAGLSSFTSDESAKRRMLYKTMRGETEENVEAVDAIGASDARGMHHQGFDLARDKSKALPTSRKLRPKDRPLENDFVSDEEFARLLRAWFGQCARVMEPGRSFYIWGGYANCSNYPAALKECGLYFSQAIIWVKEHPVLTRKDFMGNHEWCFYGWREGAAHWFNPEIHNATDVWSVKKVNPQSMVHLTEKPVELAVRAMTYSSRPGENVLDLFGGSGSTLIGAEKTGRRAFLMELDALYCDVIANRWMQFTGKEAIRVDAEANRTVHTAAN